MDMADRKGEDLRLLLESADFFKDAAIFLGSSHVKTPSSKSKASLSRVTLPDQCSV